MSLNAQTVQSDSLFILDQQVNVLQEQVDQHVNFKTQSDRIQYYQLLHELAITKAAYYTCLASVKPDSGYIAKQTAWRIQRQADCIQAKIYAMAEVEPPVVKHGGKYRY